MCINNIISNIERSYHKSAAKAKKIKYDELLSIETDEQPLNIITE